MAGSLSVNGLISGLDTESIINQLVSIQTARVDQLKSQQATQTDLITLFQSLQGLYLSLRTASDTLNGQSLYEQRTATSSNTDILSVSASNEAALGSSTLTVKQLAAKNQFVSNRFADTNVTTLGSGALDITVGTGASAVTTSLTVDSTNNTLAGIANLINQSSAKVTATIVKVDDSATPYQLVVTADEGGEANAVSITHDASVMSSSSGEVLGVGAATASQDTEDSDAKTYALRHLPNADSVVVKVGGVAKSEGIAQTATSTSASGGSLSGNTAYSYVVAAYDGSNEFIRSSIVNVTTGASDNAVDIQFGDVKGATEYRVYRVADATQDIGTAGIDINDFTGQATQIATVADDGSSSFTLTDTGLAQSAALTASVPEGDFTLDETTGAVSFFADQSGTVTADYEYDLEFRESQAAKDAIIEFGEGANAVTIRKSSNTITDVIEGVTLSLKKADASTPVIIDVKHNTSSVKSAVQSFVDALNQANDFIDKNSYFDSDTGDTGPLFSDPNVFNIRTKVSSIVTSGVASIPYGKIRSLSEIGVSINPDTGTYSVDSSKLQSALDSKPDEVRDLFASVGSASDTDVEVLSSSDDTKTSSASGYFVNITRAAARAEVEGKQDVSGGLTVDETLTITSDQGKVVGINLTNGMSAQNAVSTINSLLSEAGVSDLIASFNSATGKITIRNENYGSDHSFTIKSNVSSGTAGGTGLGSATANAVQTFVGQDVAGTINGEAATGDGQILTGNSGNANTDGLQLRVTLTPEGLASQGSAQGNVVVSRGLASQLKDFLAFLTDETQDGPIQSAIEQADNRIQDLQESIDTVNERADQERTRLQAEFNQMEQTLGTLQTTSTFLDGQLKQIAAASESIIRRKAR